MDNKINWFVTVFAFTPATKTGKCKVINPDRTNATHKTCYRG